MAALHTTSDFLLGLTAESAAPPPLEWRSDRERLLWMQQMIERLMRLPRARQERVMAAMLALLEVDQVENGQKG